MAKHSLSVSPIALCYGNDRVCHMTFELRSNAST